MSPFPWYAQRHCAPGDRLDSVKVHVSYDQPTRSGWLRTGEILYVPRHRAFGLQHEIHGCRRVQVRIYGGAR